MRLIPIMMAAVVTVTLGAPVRAGVPSAMYNPRTAFEETDLNHDGFIDHAELQDRLVDIFYRADTNRDGVLQVEEMKQLVFPQDFEADRDHDTRVTLREFLRVRFLDYDRADTDRDGELSLDEVVTAYEGKQKK